LFKVSAALDDQPKLGRYEVATLEEWKEVFDRTMKTLAGLQSPISATPFLATNDALQQVLGELDELLSHDGYINDELLSRCKTLLPTDKQADYEALIKYVLDTDYPQARTVLKTLMS